MNNNIQFRLDPEIIEALPGPDAMSAVLARQTSV